MPSRKLKTSIKNLMQLQYHLSNQYSREDIEILEKNIVTYFKLLLEWQNKSEREVNNDIA